MTNQSIDKLRDLEAFLAGEVRGFKQDAEIAKEKGFGKAVAYCLGVSWAYESALGRLREAMPGRLIEVVTRDIGANGPENA
ncbi:MAG: hypothetical protein WC356_04355 [Candidatus Micrarchaeia archaeon]|jgi:hypothetical protein